MPKRLAKKARKQTETQVSKKVFDSVYEIWLAGLGAFARTQEEGMKVFDSLVRAGQAYQARGKEAAGEKVSQVTGHVEGAVGGAKKAAQGALDSAKERATDTWDRLEEVFEARVARVLNKLGVPTAQDIHELAKRVDRLNEQLTALAGSGARRKASGRRKTAATKKSSRTPRAEKARISQAGVNAAGGSKESEPED